MRRRELCQAKREPALGARKRFDASVSSQMIMSPGPVLSAK
jgi:hypothetical protein